jgi:hypothetical protein
MSAARYRSLTVRSVSQQLLWFTDTDFHEASIERIDLLGCLVARTEYRSRSNSHKIAILLAQLDMPTLWPVTPSYCKTVEVRETREEWSWYVIQSGPVPVVQQPSDQRYESDRSNGKR